jgi:tRNA (uracil-5-)-methyltransferase TRM9
MLIDLNRTFYQTFSQQFSATRQRLQPGVQCIFDHIAGQETVLELGCGNGQFGNELFGRGHQGIYTGLDSNTDFLKIARGNLPGGEHIALVQGDLSSTDWDANLPVDKYDLVLAFAVLHHIPSFVLRKQILHKIRKLTAPGGRFIHSEWQFLNSPRLRSRIQPWEQIGITSEQVEDGDYLIDWRSGGHGLRYVHVYDSTELESIAADTDYKILDSFYSDGEGGNQAIYQIWKRV